MAAQVTANDRLMFTLFMALALHAVVLLGVLLDRNAVTMRLVAWAAFVVLLLRPESLLDVSFQMSFAAVTGLVSFTVGSASWWPS